MQSSNRPATQIRVNPNGFLVFCPNSPANEISFWFGSFIRTDDQRSSSTRDRIPRLPKRIRNCGSVGPLARTRGQHWAGQLPHPGLCTSKTGLHLQHWVEPNDRRWVSGRAQKQSSCVCVSVRQPNKPAMANYFGHGRWPPSSVVSCLLPCDSFGSLYPAMTTQQPLFDKS